MREGEDRTWRNCFVGDRFSFCRAANRANLTGNIKIPSIIRGDR